jgi:hypothetical protein
MASVKFLPDRAFCNAALGVDEKPFRSSTVVGRHDASLEDEKWFRRRINGLPEAIDGAVGACPNDHAMGLPQVPTGVADLFHFRASSRCVSWLPLT